LPIRSGFEWQEAHTFEIPSLVGTPMNPASFDIAASISSLRGFPPWQSAHEIPEDA
jgi:hypothetical protein